MRSGGQALLDAQESKGIYNTIKLPLDKGLDYVFQKPFKGIWVSDISDGANVSVKFNHKNDTGSFLSLKKNLTINHPFQVIDAKFEALPQPDKFIEITFGIDSPISIGNIEQQVFGELSLDENTIDKMSNQAFNFHGMTFSKRYLEDQGVYFKEVNVVINANQVAQINAINLDSDISLRQTMLDEKIYQLIQANRDFSIQVLAVNTHEYVGQGLPHSMFISYIPTTEWTSEYWNYPPDMNAVTGSNVNMIPSKPQKDSVKTDFLDGKIANKSWPAFNNGVLVIGNSPFHTVSTMVEMNVQLLVRVVEL